MNTYALLKDDPVGRTIVHARLDIPIGRRFYHSDTQTGLARPTDSLVTDLAGSFTQSTNLLDLEVDEALDILDFIIENHDGPGDWVSIAQRAVINLALAKKGLVNDKIATINSACGDLAYAADRTTGGILFRHMKAVDALILQSQSGEATINKDEQRERVLEHLQKEASMLPHDISKINLDLRNFGFQDISSFSNYFTYVKNCLTTLERTSNLNAIARIPLPTLFDGPGAELGGPEELLHS